jgi:hypothetical protein
MTLTEVTPGVVHVRQDDGTEFLEYRLTLDYTDERFGRITGMVTWRVTDRDDVEDTLRLAEVHANAPVSDMWDDFGRDLVMDAIDRAARGASGG